MAALLNCNAGPCCTRTALRSPSAAESATEVSAPLDRKSTSHEYCGVFSCLATVWTRLANVGLELWFISVSLPCSDLFLFVYGVIALPSGPRERGLSLAEVLC